MVPATFADRRDPAARLHRDRVAGWLDLHPAQLAALPSSPAEALDNLIDAACLATAEADTSLPSLKDLTGVAQSLEAMAAVDTAIGMPNRRVAEKYVRGLPQAARANELSLFLAEVDGSANIRDGLGGAMLEQVLGVIEGRVGTVCEGAATHQLGSSFVMALCPGVSERKASGVADDILRAVMSAPLKSRGIELSVSISLGSASAATSAAPELLVAAADRALLKVRSSGGGRAASTRIRSESMPDGDQLLSRFAKRVHDLRLEVGISKTDAAIRSGLHRTYISGIESGHRQPTLRNIVRLAAGLACPPAQLLDTL